MAMTETAVADRKAFREVLDLIRKRLSRQQYDTWFQRAELVAWDDGTLVVGVQNQFLRDWMTKKFRPVVVEAARDATGRRAEVRFEVVSEPAPPPAPAAGVADAVREAVAALTPRRHQDDPAPRAVPAPAPAPLLAGAPAAPPPAPPAPENKVAPRPAPAVAVAPIAPEPPLRLHPDYVFENFVIGPSNQMAHAKAKAVADDAGARSNPFFLYGAVGLGKTHLLQAICHEVLRRAPDMRIVYLSCEQFTNEYVSAVQRNATEAFRARFRNVDLLVIDDIHFLANKERTQEEFFRTCNARHQANKQVILSSDAPPTDIPTLAERLVSRFKSGLVEKLEQPETETRMAIIRRKAEVLALALPDDVVEYIATNVRSNIRELEGALASI